MFKKILIANRGEIACRVAATCARLAIKTVAVYSDADATAKHVSACDEAVYIGVNGSSAPKDSYLRWEAIIEAAKATGAEAIHPGYGFLSENEAFAQACLENGLVFIGPPPSAIKAMGLKAESKQLMEREAINSFGNDDVLVEKYAQRPRHIEIQVFGDTHGNCVFLFERDCSVQRRHQKVLEEAPAPGLSDAMRKQMGDAAVAAARAVNYVGAGTVEFIVEQLPDGGMKFYFMEMNTRLQVEHPVTEAITGLDLVEWQLLVASGQKLPLAQNELRINGHAIEARICAESPDNNFLPATGTLNVYGKPEATSFERGAVRVDDGVRQGDAISPFYDSMVAKLIVHGKTRQEALARLDTALAQTHIVGLNTNVQFLRYVLQSQSFAEANLDTALIPREEAVLFNQERIGLPMAAACVVAHTLRQEKTLETNDPFSRRDGWQAFGLALRRFEFEFNGAVEKAELTYLHDGALHLAVGGSSGVLQFATADSGGITVAFADQRLTANIYINDAVAHIFCAQAATKIVAIDLLAHAGVAQAEAGRLTAPMPGKVVSFAVRPGDKVSKGQPLAVMEAMKMEHTIAAPVDGVVAELLYAPGDQVTEGSELLKLVV